MADRDSDFGAFLSGFIVGGLVGAAVALLMAPQSGEETRAVIKDKSIELKDFAADQAGVARTKATEKVGEVKTKAGDAVTSAKGRAADLQKRGQVVLEEQKERLNEAIKTGKQAVNKGKSAAADGTEEAPEA